MTDRLIEAVGRLGFNVAAEIRGSREFSLDLVSNASALVDVRNESSDYGKNEYECYESPCDFFQKVGSLADTESLVACREIACKTAFAVLEKNYNGKQNTCENYQNRKDYEQSLHSYCVL